MKKAVWLLETRNQTPSDAKCESYCLTTPSRPSQHKSFGLPPACVFQACQIWWYVLCGFMWFCLDIEASLLCEGGGVMKSFGHKKCPVLEWLRVTSYQSTLTSCRIKQKWNPAQNSMDKSWMKWAEHMSAPSPAMIFERSLWFVYAVKTVRRNVWRVKATCIE